MKNSSIKTSRLLQILLLAAAMFFPKKSEAAPPNWTINPANFQFSMNLLARLKTNGSLNNAPQNIVGVFVGDELRGVAQPIFAGAAAYFFITIYSNSYAGETLNFKTYVAADDKIYNSTQAEIFKHNLLAGKFDQPFEVKICRDFSMAHSLISPTCFGNSNGTIFTSVAGLAAPYTYLWSNGKTTRDINLLAAGTYILTVTDAAGCTASQSTTLTQPPNIVFSVNFTANAPGFDAIFTTSGGTGGFTYNRTGMAANDFRVASDPVFDHLAANTSFIFKVKDANGCQKSVIKKTPATSMSGNDVVYRDDSFSKENVAENSFVISPNPCFNTLTINFLDEDTREGQVEIFNQIGQKVFTQNLKIEARGEGVLQIERLPQGVYFLVFITSQSKENDGLAGERFLKI